MNTPAPKEVIVEEVAEKEITGWLDHKKISTAKREANKESIETLIGYVRDGVLSITEDKTIIHKLLFPLDKEQPLSELKYKPRINAGAIQRHLQGVKGNDVDGRLTAYAAGIAGQPKEIIKALDTEDYSIAMSVAVFFM